MAKVLLINPNKWGRGITAIWIPAHAALLRDRGHDVELFDATFFAEWTVDEVGYNTENKQYQPTQYKEFITYKEGSVVKALQDKIDECQPDILFWSAISSHIHGEGEYVNVQYGWELAHSVRSDALRVTAGLQATARPDGVLEQLPGIDYLIRGESELALAAIADNVADKSALRDVNGLAYKDENGTVCTTPPQPILSDLDILGPYNYDLFEEQVFWRPYNGHVVKAVDYELSRGCIYTCEYCVETVIQDYYGFDEITPSGSLRNAKAYLRAKSPQRIFDELTYLHREKGITLYRCQDTNFLTINRSVLVGLAELLDASDLNIKLYIETRPEGITQRSIELLQRLKVDGVGMGIELSTEDFREDKLRRYASQSKIIAAFELLKNAGIKRTSYNIIGLPEQDEVSIQETIRFNELLNPDNCTVAFYSPYVGTAQQLKANNLGYFDDYEFHVDGQLRTMSHDTLVSPDMLCFYKKHFSRLVREGLSNVESLKEEYFLSQVGCQRGVGSASPTRLSA